MNFSKWTRMSRMCAIIQDHPWTTYVIYILYKLFHQLYNKNWQDGRWWICLEVDDIYNWFKNRLFEILCIDIILLLLVNIYTKNKFQSNLLYQWRNRFMTSTWIGEGRQHRYISKNGNVCHLYWAFLIIILHRRVTLWWWRWIGNRGILGIRDGLWLDDTMTWLTWYSYWRLHILNLNLTSWGFFVLNYGVWTNNGS